MESGNSGIRFTTGTIVTLIGLTIMLALFTLFYLNAKTMQDKEREFRQKENDSISYNIDLNDKEGLVCREWYLEI